MEKRKKECCKFGVCPECNCCICLCIDELKRLLTPEAKKLLLKKLK